VCRASRLAGVGRDGWGFLPDVAAAMGLSGARARAQAPRGSRRRLRALGLAVLGALVVSLVVSKAAQAYVYWANRTDTIGATGTIARSNLDGSGANQSFITGASSPGGVAVDAAHVYWANTGTIARANLDGTGVNQRFITGASDPDGVAVDAAHVYWANLGTNTIARANLDGSGANQRFITGAEDPFGVAVDAAHVYWANTGTSTIARANLDGSGANLSFITALGPGGVAVDAAHVYWANTGINGLGTIARANLDGSGANQRFITAGSYPDGVAVDAAHVYWVNGVGYGPPVPRDTQNTIARANLDGSGANQRFITGASFPSGVAVDALTLPPPPVGVVNEPRISVTGVASSRCRRANFRAHVSVSDALKLKRVDVVLDGRRIVHTHAKRIGARVLAIRLRAGSHTLKIIATDAAGKTTVLVVHFTRCG